MSGYQHVEQVMGTAVSIDVRDDVVGTPGLDEILTWLHWVDQTFSTYREDSEITRLGRKTLSIDQANAEVRLVLHRCEEIRIETGGVFDIFQVPAPNGTTFDPSGFVKGWSIELAAQQLTHRGLGNFCINAGGDVVVRGCPAPHQAWRIGIRHPDDPLAIIEVVEGAGSFAVATSATYERGAHIIDPRTGYAVTDLASATVVGPDLGVADSYATALFVLGVDGIDWIETRPGYEALVVDHDATMTATTAFTGLRTSTRRP